MERLNNWITTYQQKVSLFILYFAFTLTVLTGSGELVNIQLHIWKRNHFEIVYFTFVTSNKLSCPEQGSVFRIEANVIFVVVIDRQMLRFWKLCEIKKLSTLLGFLSVFVHLTEISLDINVLPQTLLISCRLTKNVFYFLIFHCSLRINWFYVLCKYSSIVDSYQ